MRPLTRQQGLAHAPPRRRGRRALAPACAVKARWLIDCKYGAKMEAVALLQDWVARLGSRAGLRADNTSILSGAVGAPESRLELEVAFESLADLERFWGAIPPAEHRAWSERAKEVLLDGSPHWLIYRTVPIPWAGQGGPSASAEAPPSRQGGGARPPAGGLQQLVTAVEDPAEVEAVLGGQREVLDWKGDPIRVNPGDKLFGIL